MIDARASALPRLCAGLAALLLLAACPPAGDDAENPTTAEPDMGEVRDPRPVTELWPLVLAKRDEIRATMNKPDLWHEDLEKLDAHVLALLELVTEAGEWAKASGFEGRDYSKVMRGVGDVRVAVLPIRQGIEKKMPLLWKQGPRLLDQALAAFEMRFPDVTFPEKVKDRPDYGELVS